MKKIKISSLPYIFSYNYINQLPNIAVNAAPRAAGGGQQGGAQPQRQKQFLEVKHVTRVNEPAMMVMDVTIDK